MKTLVLLAAFLVLASAAPGVRKPQRDLSKYQDRAVLYPHLTRLSQQSNRSNRGRFQGRIVGGNETDPNEYPHQCALFIAPGGYFCGGQLIGDQWVMTAAHCADGATEIEVVLGAHNIRDESEATQVSVFSRGADITVHPNWNTVLIRDFLIINDIALLKLETPVELNDVISPAALAAATGLEDPEEDDLVVASGWGKPTNDAPGISEVLREVEVPVITNERCSTWFPLNIRASMICIRSQGGHGTCNGDSGGPLTQGDAETGFTTFGITSFGSGIGCEAGLPDVFTRVSSFRDWVTEVTGI